MRARGRICVSHMFTEGTIVESIVGLDKGIDAVAGRVRHVVMRIDRSVYKPADTCNYPLQVLRSCWSSFRSTTR